MARFKKLSLDEARETFTLLSEAEQRAIKGGCSKCEEARSYGYNVYTQGEFEQMLDNGTWDGGYVCGLGFFLGEVDVYGYPVHYDYNVQDYCNYLLSQGLGMGGCVVFRGSVTDHGQQLKVSASAMTPVGTVGNVTYFGYVELYVDGVLKQTAYFDLGESYIYQSGTNPLGIASFDKPASGFVEIRLIASYAFESNGNNQRPAPTNKVIFTKQY